MYYMYHFIIVVDVDNNQNFAEIYMNSFDL